MREPLVQTFVPIIIYSYIVSFIYIGLELGSSPFTDFLLASPINIIGYLAGTVVVTVALSVLFSGSLGFGLAIGAILLPPASIFVSILTDSSVPEIVRAFFAAITLIMALVLVVFIRRG